MSAYIFFKLTLEHKKPHYRKYVIDEFYNMVWRWSPNSDLEEAYNLTAFCALDDTRIDWRYNRFHEQLGFCITCGFKTIEVEGLQSILEKNIQLQREKRIRNKSYKDAKIRLKAIRKIFEEANQEYDELYRLGFNV